MEGSPTIEILDKKNISTSAAETDKYGVQTD